MTMKHELIKIGAIIATRGLQGEVKVFPTTDFIEDRFFVGAKVMLAEKNEVKKLVTIKEISTNKNNLGIKFKEINSINEAEEYLRFDIVIKKTDAKLPKGYVFDEEMIGLDVYTTEGVFVGKVKEVMAYTSQKTLRISRDQQKDLLVPIVEYFVKETDLEAKKIIINVIEGML